MTWTAPMTAVATAAFTAAQFNTHVRDNLNETAPAKATAPSVSTGNIFVASGLNSIVQRIVTSATVSTSETTTSTSYTDLTTPGPQVVVTTGTTAIVIMSATLTNTTNAARSKVSVGISGATTLAGGDAYALIYDSSPASSVLRASACQLITGLTPGSSTFSLKYAVGSGTGAFANRQIVVIPF